MPDTTSVTSYYQQITAIDIEAIANELIGAPATKTPQESAYNCPHHDSQSKRSLAVTPREGLWTCFGCGIGGDVIQLVEFVQTGQVTIGVRGEMPDSHRAARDWLAQKIGLDPLSSIGLTDAQIKEAERQRAADDFLFATLTEIAWHYHDRLMEPEHANVREWIAGKWGFDEDVLRHYRIGFSDQDGADQARAIHARLRKRGINIQAEHLARTGAFRVRDDKQIVSHLYQRIIFPYGERGRCIYMIGRSTPWTSDRSSFAKYKKLLMNGGGKNPDVSTSIVNPVWGLHALTRHPETVVVTEGITDAIASSAAGWPTISPVTTRFSHQDSDRVIGALKHSRAKKVVIIQDVEVSRVGLNAAIGTARRMKDDGINVSVAMLPLNDDQREALNQLTEALGDDFNRWGTIRSRSEKTDVAKKAGHTLDSINELIGRAKTDVAEYLRTIGNEDSYRDLIESASGPLRVAIENAPCVANKEEQIEAINDLLVEVTALSPAAQEEAIGLLKTRTRLPKRIIRQELSARGKAAKKKRASEARRSLDHNGASVSVASNGIFGEAGSLKRLLCETIELAKATKEPIDWGALTARAYQWFVEQGAAFYTDSEGQFPRLFWGRRVYDIRRSSHQFVSLFLELTGLSLNVASGRTILDGLAALATTRGEIRERISWIHSQKAGRVGVFVQLENKDCEIAKVTSDGVELIPNGQNDDRIVLGRTRMRPVEYRSEEAPPEVLFDRMIGSVLACNDSGKSLIRDWIFCLPLLEFADTRPMLRLEGPSGSGKTSAAKLIGTLIYGTEVQKTATVPALYADAERNPVGVLDNLETSAMSPGVLDFMIMAVTGITREKMASANEISRIRPLQLVVSTGIEPLAPDLDEVLSRTITVEFGHRYLDAATALESALAVVKADRCRLLSAILDRTAVVLGLIEDGVLTAVLDLLRREFPAGHAKARALPYFALMYLQRVASAEPEDRPALIDQIDSDFFLEVADLALASQITAGESNPIAILLRATFGEIRHLARKAAHTADTAAEQHFGDLSVNPSGTRLTATAGGLFGAFCRVARDAGIPMPYRNPTQLARRLGMSVDALREGGYRVRWSEIRARVRVWEIVDVNSQNEEPKWGDGNNLDEMWE